MDQRYFDDYSFTTENRDEMENEVCQMEAHSEWIPGVTSSELRLEAIEAPIYATEAALRYGLNVELMNDTAGGTKLLLDSNGQKMMVRDTAKTTLSETAKLFGTALGRMETPLMAETLNNGLSVARGCSLLLMRYGKVSAVHSDGESGYQIMPIRELLSVSEQSLHRDFGELQFVTGSNTHGHTTVLWELPEAQSDILQSYQDALSRAPSHFFAINMMPAVRLMTSDTANSCACLSPVFVSSGTEYGLVEGLSVKHSKRFVRNGKTGMDAFSDGSGEIYAMFKASTEVVARLAQIEIINGCNCVVSLCKRYGIPKKYGETARILVERLTAGGRSISAHDLYLCMTNIASEARNSGAGWIQVLNLQETVAKIVNTDWEAHDVGGIVSWGA